MPQRSRATAVARRGRIGTFIAGSGATFQIVGHHLKENFDPLIL
jgi:hypothetical protein